MLLVHVTLLYALRGVDPVPEPPRPVPRVHRRDGHTYLAGDDALTGETIASWVGPWHYGPLVAVAGARSLVLGPPGERRRSCSALAGEVDAAVASGHVGVGDGLVAARRRRSSPPTPRSSPR